MRNPLHHQERSYTTLWGKVLLYSSSYARNNFEMRWHIARYARQVAWLLPLAPNARLAEYKHTYQWFYTLRLQKVDVQSPNWLD